MRLRDTRLDYCVALAVSEALAGSRGEAASMNRRTFLQRFGIGVSAALALAALPASAIQALTTEQAAKRCAIEYLRKAYTDHVRGKSVSQHPRAFYVSQGLYDAYEGEIVANQRAMESARWEHTRQGLMFKGSKVEAKAELRGWDVVFPS